MKRKKRKIKSSVIVTIFILFFILFIYSAYKVIIWKLNVEKNKNINEIIKENIQINNEETNDEYKYKVDFEALKKQNQDTVAYLKVNGTNIDYVVVKGNDNSYYLKHNFNKEYNIAGWIFADYKNKFDGTDKNIVVFGHNTKDGSMFGTLKNVLSEDWQNNKDNLQITFVIERKEYLYQVFSTYSIKPEEYYIKTDFESNDEYIEFLNELKERSNHDYKVDISPNDTILTLSSCVGDGSKRVVLHAKKIY
jgi:sortase B